MNIQQFQYILAVVDMKNFEEAAEKCHVTQSTCLLYTSDAADD